MSDDHGELPDSPLSAHDIERITREAGGEIVAILQRAHQDRLAIGAYVHPHKMQGLNTVTIRMYLNGKPTESLDLSLSETQGTITALLEAVSICWGKSPDEVIRTAIDDLYQDQDGDQDQDDQDEDEA